MTSSALESKMLQEDVAAMIRDGLKCDCDQVPSGELAWAVITVIRERVLREIESYARENIR